MNTFQSELHTQPVRKPRNAIILAAGFGIRMVPINRVTPKALLQVHGEPLIERLIRQLHQADIHDITVVIGFMKESFEYLIDAYGVKLVVNDAYNTRGNLHSLALAAHSLQDTYVLPCDIWCRENPFHQEESDSWYMVKQDCRPFSQVRLDESGQLLQAHNSEGNSMIGISWLRQEDSMVLREKLLSMDQDPTFEKAFWEDALYESDKMLVKGRAVSPDTVVEINTYEQLRDLDCNSNHLKAPEIDIICRALSCRPEEITHITMQKKGMTNRSFLFTCRNTQYIMRVPGEGTDQLINRREEASVYQTINGLGLCDNILFIDPETGFKITEFIHGARVCDPENLTDVKRCMEKLRAFHRLNLKVEHSFDIFGKIEFYESLWEGQPSVYQDYAETKANVLSLKPYIDAHAETMCLTHIDAVPDNFLFFQNEDGQEELRLIDWEYAAMQDPHVDLAMFCIYALYDPQQVDTLIDLYFTEGCSKENRLKIYCYIAACGLLWSNWCEYKRNLGVEFGEYSLRQYRYAKDYYRMVRKELDRL